MKSTILVKNVGALDTDCAKFDSHIKNKHSNPPPPFPRSMLCVVCYMSKVLHNIVKGDRGCLNMKFCIKWASIYMVIRNEVKVMLFRLSAPRIFDQDSILVKNVGAHDTDCAKFDSTSRTSIATPLSPVQCCV